jgi:hypothetical protein
MFSPSYLDPIQITYLNDAQNDNFFTFANKNLLSNLIEIDSLDFKIQNYSTISFENFLQNDKDSQIFTKVFEIFSIVIKNDNCRISPFQINLKGFESDLIVDTGIVVVTTLFSFLAINFCKVKKKNIYWSRDRGCEKRDHHNTICFSIDFFSFNLLMIIQYGSINK